MQLRFSLATQNHAATLSIEDNIDSLRHSSDQRKLHQTVDTIRCAKFNNPKSYCPANQYCTTCTYIVNPNQPGGPGDYATSCSNCPSGTISPEGSYLQSQCVSCGIGKYANNEFAKTALPGPITILLVQLPSVPVNFVRKESTQMMAQVSVKCARQERTPQILVVRCVLIALPVTFAAGYGSEVCSACSPGTKSDTGATACSGCTAGKFADGSANIACVILPQWQIFSCNCINLYIVRYWSNIDLR